jgi:hypothetical protein
MYFHEAEVVELGLAEELIQDDVNLVNSEGSTPSKIKRFSAVHVADAE